MAVDKIG